MHPNDNLAIHFNNAEGPKPKYIIFSSREHSELYVPLDDKLKPGQTAHRLTEFIYVSAGSGLALIGNDKYPISAGDFYIINPGVSHDEALRHNDFHTFLQYYIIGIENVSFENPENPVHVPTNVAESRIPFLFRELRKESLDNTQYTAKTVQLLFKLLLTDVNRHLKYNEIEVRHNSLNQSVNMVQKYLDEHFAENINVKTVAELFFCNESTLSHNFRKHLNCSIMEYVMENRLNCAKMWLQISNKSIAEIASLSGFSTASYFCEYFKRMVKQTPLQYRKAYHATLNTRKSILKEEDYFNQY